MAMRQSIAYIKQLSLCGGAGTMTTSKIRGRPDFLLLFLTVFLVCFGLVMIFSASSPSAVYFHDNAWRYAQRQGIFACIGLIAMLFCMAIPYQIWKKSAPLLILTSVVLLLMVLLFGTRVDGAVRWFSMGGFNFQPSEFAKLAIIIYLAAMISRKGEKIRHFSQGLLPILIVIGIILALILKQPDFGTLLILLSITLIIISFGGVDFRHLFLLGIILVPVLVYLAVSKSYRLKRISSFLNPMEDLSGSGYQLSQSLYALGHGGWTGTGLGQSIQKLFYLPAAHTDFIFSVIGEELGFFGAALIVIVFMLFVWRGFVAAIRCNNMFGMLMGVGIVSMIIVQVLLNIGAVTGSLPITGVTLPFISYGGSSLILSMASTGILLSISRERSGKRPQNTRFNSDH